MLKTLFFVITCLLAFTFFALSRKLITGWMRKSFVLYGIMFTLTAVFINVNYIHEKKPDLLPIITERKIVKPGDMLVSQYSIQKEVKLKVPKIDQLPELPRGCEVTSLAMLLQYHGIKTGKMELANQVKRNTAVYKETAEGIFYGNPHKGFVGDMYSYKNPGLGVYHGPIRELAKKYINEDQVHDFTGADFAEIINQLNHNRPVWVIINTSYKKLSENHFETWQTDSGPIRITKKEHSVLITGYDQEYIYFNDPLNIAKKAPIEDFQAAWEQMGKQAITVY